MTYLSARRTLLSLAFTIALPSSAQILPPPPDGDDQTTRAGDQVGGPRGDQGNPNPQDRDGDRARGDRNNPPRNNVAVTPEQVALGQFLFFDKELSGNRNISCASCHHPLTNTSDALSLGIGEGGVGLGAVRTTGSGADAVVERVPRNSPALFNLGRRNLPHVFHDGRVERDDNSPSGFASPAGEDLPLGLNNILAVQALFPVTSTTEMAGQGQENSIAVAAEAGDLASPLGVWELLAQRLRNIPAYEDLFRAAFPDEVQSSADINMVQAANAIAAFEANRFSANNSPFDRHQAGEANAMTASALRGMEAFQDRGCAGCHSGRLQTDDRFHAIAMPQIGPGKGDNSEGFNDGHEDFGRERVTSNPDDRFRFRTPTLRNVELTAPYGHAGAYGSLEAMVRHYINPIRALQNYDASQTVLPFREDLNAQDLVVMNNPQRVAAIANAARNEGRLRPRNMSDQEVSDIVEFLRALTDPASLELSAEIPFSAPSGLPIID